MTHYFRHLCTTILLFALLVDRDTMIVHILLHSLINTICNYYNSWSKATLMSPGS